VIAALAAIAAHLIVVAATDSDEQLSVLSIALTSLVACLAGAWIYRLLTQRSHRPIVLFAVIAAAAAVADTVLAGFAGQGSGFVIEAGVLHVVVAVVAAIGIPKALR